MASSKSSFYVQSPNVEYTEDCIYSKFNYQTSKVEENDDGSLLVKPIDSTYYFRTQRHVPKLGVMMVGWGGNNGSTITASVIANKLGITWNTKNGVKKANYYGSITQSSTVCLGTGTNGDVYVPLKNLLPMVDPNDVVFDGWDISSASIADAMERAEVLDINLQKQLRPYLEDMHPRPSIYFPDFIAANQLERANNVLTGSHWDQMNAIRSDIRDFRNKHNLDKVIVLWTANTERFSDVHVGLNDTADNLLQSIKRNESEISPSTLFAVASILEECCFLNGSPQNTLVPGVVDLACQKKVFIGGDDFKSGQTKVKSVLVDFLVNAGIKPTSIVSYNHLGNNDGKNLSAPKQFKSKEISKSNVVDDMVASNQILYEPGEKPDHTIVIKYVPYVKDSKRALDEYTSEIFMGGHNTLVIHNTCEDSLLASPIILDLVILSEVCQRISLKTEISAEYESFHSVLSILSYLLKAPAVPPGTPVVNALFKQRACIENIFRACVGLAPQNHMSLEHKRACVPDRNVLLAEYPWLIENGYQNGHQNGTNGHHNKTVKAVSNGHVNNTGNGIEATNGIANGHHHVMNGNHLDR